MSPPSSSLLVRWEVAEERGQPLSPEQLCADRPELIAPLAEVITLLRQVRELLRLTRPADGLAPTLIPAGRSPLASAMLVRWERAREQGEELTAEALCPDLPGVREPLRLTLEAFRRLCEQASAGPASQGPSTLAPESMDVVPTLPPGSAAPPAAVAAIPPEYEILEELGRGGMGVVYRARQVALNRVCALKMILAGAHASEEERARFLVEAEAIARVKHPGIVQVYDLGTLGGLPYFSMELCEGGSLADRLQPSPLPPRDAAVLVEQIARAVQAAHEAGIVHRDLKPANVLLSSPLAGSPPGDEEAKPRAGTPKITDFGLAKRIETPGHTQTGAVLGTPSYMPPEQAAGSKDVGPLADVWALGAILYECLSGRPPFKAATSVETILLVINEEPVPLRQMLSLPRDLETICHKCLQKDPARRYASALALADDLRNFLDGRPIEARPVSRAERLVRWCRRNPTVTAVSAAALLFLVGGLVGMTLLYFRAEEQRRQADTAREQVTKERDAVKAQKQRAEEHAARERQASKILKGMFDSSDPLGLNGFTFGIHNKAGQDLKARDLLERAVQKTRDDKNLDPVVKAIVYHDVGNVYRSLGLHDQAEPLLREALEIRRKHSTSPNDLADSLHAWAWLLHERGDYLEAEKFYLQSLSERAKDPEPNEAARLNTKLNLGWLYVEMEMPTRAEEHLKEVLEGRIALFGEDDRETALARLSMAGGYLNMGRPLDAVPHLERARETLRKLGTNDDVLEAVAKIEQGVILEQVEGKRDKALEELREALRLTQKALGERHIYVILPLVQLAKTEQNAGKYKEAHDHFTLAFDVGRQASGLTHPKMLEIAVDLAALERRSGKAIDGTRRLEEVLAAIKKQYGDKHVFYADALLALANHERDSYRSAEAQKYYEKAEPIYEANRDRLPRRYGVFLREKGHHFYYQWQFAESEKAYRGALKIKRDFYKEQPHGEVCWAILYLLYAKANQDRYDKEYESQLGEGKKLIEKLPLGQRPPLRVYWAILQSRLLCYRYHDHRQAVKLLDENAAGAKDGYEHEELARAYTLCYRFAERDDVPQEMKELLKQRYAESAVRHLRLWWKAAPGAPSRWRATEWALLDQQQAFLDLRKEAGVPLEQ